MKVMDKNCPKDQEEKVERILDIAYSCDLGWYSTVPLKKKVWLWYLMQESGLVSFKVFLCLYVCFAKCKYCVVYLIPLFSRCVLHVQR